MPSTCAMPGCKSRGVKGFFRFPSEKRETQRRHAWIAAVRRVKPWIPTPYPRICHRHFATGRPSRSPKHVDYVPCAANQNDENSCQRRTDALQRLERSQRWFQQKKNEYCSRSSFPQSTGKGYAAHSSSEKSGSESLVCDEGSTSSAIESTSEDGHTDLELMAAESLILLQQDKSTTKFGTKTSCATITMSTENQLLKMRIQALEEENRNMSLRVLSLRSIPDSKFKYYTGFKSKQLFHVIFKHVEGNARRMNYWQMGPRTEDGARGRQRAVSLDDEFLMVLVKLRTGMPSQEITRNFGISEATFSRIFTTWVKFLDQEQSAQTHFPSPNGIKQDFPKSFSCFQDTRVVIDFTEIKIQRPSRLTAQRQTFSNYKHYNTCKVLVGVIQDGYLCFVSNLWGGHVSDGFIVKESGLLDHLRPGDAIMADKGFKLECFLPPGIKLYVPPFRKSMQMPPSDVKNTRKIASARIDIERLIRRIKEFHIFDSPISINMMDIAGHILRVYAFLSKFQDPS
ncbi:uncharacterized protein LOC135368466 isoform X2 [Ornithodoros turicata]|uniref:uncharacterized protein LOC135368466 isoform X2 n=1 Tax=Ornithodoros turicata TaxID=34597 RepID=UPI00313922BF